MNIATFRADFTEFADVTKYPNSLITLWSTLAEANVSLDKWGDIRNMGVELYTAHNLLIAKDSSLGKQSGVQSSKAVGDVSVSYDTASTLEVGAGFWNTTNYGKQFFRLSRMYGVGAVQL